MATQGFGKFPFGLFPFGFWTNETTTSGVEQPTKYIEHFDVSSKDYVLDASGNPSSTTSVRQKVEMIIALTGSGSVSNPEIGLAMQQFGKIDSGFQLRVHQIVSNAFSTLIQNKELELVTVDVTTLGTTAVLEIEFVDLTTNTTEFVRGTI